MRRLFHWFVCCLLALLAHVPSQALASDIEIVQARLEAGESGYRLASGFQFELNRGLEDAIYHGVPLYFTTEVELSRPRWYLFSERSISTKQTIRISYNVLTRQYNAAILGSLQQNYRTLEDALSLVRRPLRWTVADFGELEVGETYTVAVRMMLDVSQLPKPFQVNAINNRNWRLSSDWKRFYFTAEK
ncbi:MAG: DUF4390 domain-containing protein [Burkholderiaceae bacterium]|nr:DUF4390 domain-containing protein [Burkholderiaceae bacterium]